MTDLPLSNLKKEFLINYLKELGWVLSALYPEYKIPTIMTRVLIYFYLDLKNNYLFYKGEDYIINMALAADCTMSSIRTAISKLNHAGYIRRLKSGIYQLELDFEIIHTREFDNNMITIRRKDKESLTYSILIPENHQPNIFKENVENKE